MTYSLSFLPEVEDDAISGYSWYEDKAFGLGEEFLRIFYAAVNNLSRNPLLYKKVYGDFRRLLLRRFPYAIYFLVEDNKIIIFGLFHCARDPQTIELTLFNRET
jgi:plasmid stabilization system protein ParE